MGVTSTGAGRRYGRLASGCAFVYVTLALVASFGWLRPLDHTLTRHAYADAPCGIRNASTIVDPLFSGEASVLFAGIGALLLLWYRRPVLAIGVVAAMLATLPIEAASKHLLEQPSPERFVATIARPSCAASAPNVPLRSAQAVQAALPSAAAGEIAYTAFSSLPSGYIARATYFAMLLLAAIAARRPRAVVPAIGILAATLAFLGASRVIVAWHWPTDVLAGALLGTGMACALLALPDIAIGKRLAAAVRR